MTTRQISGFLGDSDPITESVSFILKHPTSGAPLYMGETPESEDFMFSIQAGARQRVSKVYTTDLIDVRVNLYGYALGADWGVMEYRFPFYDGPVDSSQIQRIRTVADLALRSWEQGDRVAINCQAGLNRSGLITALVLREVGYSSEDAIAHLRKSRSPWVLCNRDFEQWLLNLDKTED